MDSALPVLHADRVNISGTYSKSKVFTSHCQLRRRTAFPCISDTYFLEFPDICSYLLTIPTSLIQQQGVIVKSTRFVFFLSFASIILGHFLLAQEGKSKPPSMSSSSSESTIFKTLRARSIGPAVMGGRVSDIAYDPENLYTFYIGLATGGVMKTSDNGATFKAIFEKESVASIGAIAVSPVNPKFVWVGTGEANDRNSSSWGNGVYLSTDAGDSWQNVGLKESKTIARIIPHPTDSNTVWVAAMGDLWNRGNERGLFKTTDAGKTWKQIFAAPGQFADRVGCGDVVMNPSDPNTIVATLYGRRRTPWSFTYGASFTDGKDIGGIFKTTDGGATWKKLTAGLPAMTGRIGLAIYLKNPNILYAIIQSDEGGASDIDNVKSRSGGVFRSEDAGETWKRVNSLNPRPFYFSQIRVDPSDDKKVYVLAFALHVSDDGGQSFREDRFSKVHPDCHALVIDPRFPKRLLLGTDGGVYQSFNGGEAWEHLDRFAGGEFYRITLDMGAPYRIAGGLQDNLNWVGPSMTRTKDGIVNSDWINIDGGDGFYCVFDPEDPQIMYAESQQGYIHRFNLASGQTKGLRPEQTEGQPGYRFHWNSPFIASRHTKGVMYLAGNRIFKLTNHGEHFELISPDLSTQDPAKITAVGSGAENYGVVYTLAESPMQAGMLWAGTDDGKLWLTEDDGAHWKDLTSNLPSVAKGQWVSRIEASHHDAKVAYLAVSAYRSGNYAPLLYRTADAGKSWQSIASNLPNDGPTKVIREDPKNPLLLFVGTEFGPFISTDKGGLWTKFGGLPTVAVDDIQIHPRDLDLVIATHGRSIYILDDIRPLEELTPEIARKDAHLFTIRDAFGFHPLPGFVDWKGITGFRGANPPVGAFINVYVKDYTGEEVKIGITNEAGRPVANLSAVGTPSIVRMVWDLKMTKDLLNDYGGEGQKFVKPGEYTVTLTYGKTKQTQKLHVEMAPGVETR